MKKSCIPFGMNAVSKTSYYFGRHKQMVETREDSKQKVTRPFGKIGRTDNGCIQFLGGTVTDLGGKGA